MRGRKRRPGAERGLAATMGALALSGVICIGVAVTQQQQQQPPLSAVDPRAPTTREPAARVVGPLLPESAPLALAIPAIGVESPLLQLGLTRQDSLQLPGPGPHYDEAGWYRGSPTPGSLGPAVIAGHVDSKAAGPSVFFRLGTLRPRDSVLITRADGSVAVFAVDDVRRFRKSRFPTDLVYGNTNRAALRLISCGGAFDRNTGHYRDNIVVFASLVRANAARPRMRSPLAI